MNQNHALLLIAAFSLLIILPIIAPFGAVSAQTSNYTINQVDHHIQILYSGDMIIQDTIHITGQITDGFLIGIPYDYSAYVLKAQAYDNTHIYQITTGIQLGDHSGFYGAQVNFNGNTPSTFTVSFILSSRLIIQQESYSALFFPAYPGLTQDVGTCNTTLTFPTKPTSLSISKPDGDTGNANFIKSPLPAYTYAPATASFEASIGTVQPMMISTLNRQITIDPSGTVTAVDNYRVINNATSTMNSFQANVPLDATNIVIKDDVGRSLTAYFGVSANGRSILGNATLVTFLTAHASTVITAQYNLPSATLQGSNYELNDFQVVPDFNYYVYDVTVSFVPPEGATITVPQVNALDSSSTVTRQTLQDTLTIKREGASDLDYLAPQQNTVQFAYSYNPVWVSFRPSIIAMLLSIVGCMAVVFVQRRRPTAEETSVPRTERVSTVKSAPVPSAEEKAAVEVKPGQRVTAEDMKEFVDDYDDRKQLTSELKALDSRAQRGKLPRRQYKVQRRAIEIRLEGLTRHIEHTKELLRVSGSAYADIARQLDDAEADLADAEENIKSLETRQNTGEISLEAYKRDIGDFQKRRDKAESTINGILLRLREKIR